VRPDTIPRLLAYRCAQTPGDAAFGVAEAPGAWRFLTWKEFSADVNRLARALADCGIGRGSRLAIVARTSVDWERTQMAALKLGAVAIGIDPNYPDATLAQVLEATAPKAIFIDDASTLDRLPASIRASFELAVAFRGDTEGGRAGVRSLRSMIESAPAGPYPSGSEPSPEDPAIVVFTSGTTGPPRPIAYSHRQVVLAVDEILAAFPDIGEGSRLLCWLPLANLFQRIINFCAVARGATSYVIADPREVMLHLTSASPHVFIGVPRFFEKVQAGIEDRLTARPALTRAFVRWALALGRRRERGIGWWLAELFALRRLRAVFGKDARYLISGSAPMPQSLLEWFEAIGLPVLEAYGVSEDIVPVAMNRPGVRRPGTVGKPTPANEVRLGPDGEVLVRGEGVFNGYLGADSIQPDREGFWATGDLGEFTPDGFLRLRGRKSESFKTSGGHWIVAGNVETLLQQIPYVEHAVLAGSSEHALTAILNIDLARFRGNASASELSFDECTRIAVDAGDALAAVPRYSRPAALLVVTTAFSVAGGELTTNLKLRRALVIEKFKPQLARLRAAARTPDDAARPVVLAA